MVFKLNTGAQIQLQLVKSRPIGKNRAGQGLGAGVVADGHADRLARQRELLRPRAVHIGADFKTTAASANDMPRRAASDAAANVQSELLK